MDLTERQLLRDGKPVPLTPKAYETLVLLVKNSGRIIEKEEFLKSVWLETYVEDATLAQNIFTIRQALAGPEGKQYVQTVPKRGYRFVANVTEIPDENPDVQPEEPGQEAEEDQAAESVAENGVVRSLAGLPFVNATADPNTEHLSDGIAASIVNTLSLVPELRIKASSTVLQYRDEKSIHRKRGAS